MERLSLKAASMGTGSVLAEVFTAYWEGHVPGHWRNVSVCGYAGPEPWQPSLQEWRCTWGPDILKAC